MSMRSFYGFSSPSSKCLSCPHGSGGSDNSRGELPDSAGLDRSAHPSIDQSIGQHPDSELTDLITRVVMEVVKKLAQS
jgi:hypothetical protein